jgi:predicted nucleotidyltransferase
MNSSNPSQKLTHILLGLSSTILAQHGNNYLACIQFGSTTRPPLKKETDIDLLIVFENLPKTKVARSKIINSFEIEFEPLLGEFRATNGHNLYPSIILKEFRELTHVAPYMLDMVTFHGIVYQKSNEATWLLQKIKEWMDFHQSKRIEYGNLWYWMLDTVAPAKADIDLQFLE